MNKWLTHQVLIPQHFVDSLTITNRFRETQEKTGGFIDQFPCILNADIIDRLYQRIQSEAKIDIRSDNAEEEKKWRGYE